MTKIRKIIIVGAGGFGREIACWLEHSAPTTGVRIAGFLDDTMAPAAALRADYPYPLLGAITDYAPDPQHELIVAIGDPRAKLRIGGALAARGARFYNMIHPTALVARTARLGKGLIMFPYTIVSSNAVVGDFVTINAFGGVGHDAVVGDGTTLCAQVDVTGHVTLGEGVFVGSNASILPRVQVGDYAVIGAGTVVLRRVDAGNTIYAPLSKKL